LDVLDFQNKIPLVVASGQPTKQPVRLAVEFFEQGEKTSQKFTANVASIPPGTGRVSKEIPARLAAERFKRKTSMAATRRTRTKAPAVE